MHPLTTIAVRDATIHDIPVILSIKSAFEQLADRDQVDYHEYYLHLLRDGMILIADVEGHLSGYIACEDHHSLCYISDAGVVLSEHRHGIFSALAIALESRIRTKGFRRVVCHVKETNNIMIEILEKKLHFKRGDRYVLFSREND